MPSCAIPSTVPSSRFAIFNSWLGAVNNLRLVLGTVLDVSEELEIGELPEATPDVEAYALYAYLSSLLGEMVDALDPD